MSDKKAVGARPKAVVTGGGGQLGRALAARLAAEWDVTALGRAELDVTDRDAVIARFATLAPALVVNAAAMTDVDGCESDPSRAFRTNGLGALHVALAAQESGARFVQISTDFIFDGEKATPYVETDAPNPLSRYGESKLAGESYVLRESRGALVVRTAWLYGPGGRNFVDTILGLGAKGGPLQVVADQAGSPTWTRDLADGIARVVGAGMRGVVHVANTGHATRYELARRALDLAGLASVDVRPVPTAEMPRPARRPRHAVLGSSLLAAAGVAPLRRWDEALAEHVALRSAGSSAGTRIS